MNIRLLGDQDLAKLLEVGRQTFIDAFASMNHPDDFAKYMSAAFTPERLAEEMHTPGTTFYFAEEGSEVIGYLKLNEGAAQSDLHDSSSLEVERIYVCSAWQGKGMGGQLLDFAIRQARQKSLQYIWLGVWEKNTGARRFYQKAGFREFGSHVFYIGHDPQTDILMRKDFE